MCWKDHLRSEGEVHPAVGDRQVI